MNIWLFFLLYFILLAPYVLSTPESEQSAADDDGKIEQNDQREQNDQNDSGNDQNDSGDVQNPKEQVINQSESNDKEENKAIEGSKSDGEKQKSPQRGHLNGDRRQYYRRRNVDLDDHILIGPRNFKSTSRNRTPPKRQYSKSQSPPSAKYHGGRMHKNGRPMYNGGNRSNSVLGNTHQQTYNLHDQPAVSSAGYYTHYDPTQLYYYPQMYYYMPMPMPYPQQPYAVAEPSSTYDGTQYIHNTQPTLTAYSNGNINRSFARKKEKYVRKEDSSADFQKQTVSTSAVGEKYSEGLISGLAEGAPKSPTNYLAKNPNHQNHMTIKRAIEEGIKNKQIPSHGMIQPGA